MKRKLLLVLCMVMPYFLIASDMQDDVDGSSFTYQATYLSDSMEKGENNTELLPKKSVLTSMKEKLPTLALTDEHKRVMHNASLILADLGITFGNVVGRLVLMGFFTHKSFKNLRKLLNE